jgi:hypothetical protein
MDRTLTKILLARTSLKEDLNLQYDVVTGDQLSGWSASNVCSCAGTETSGLTSESATVAVTSPRRGFDRNATDAVLGSCACYADMFNKRCVDRISFRYIPHNRMYLQCKAAARVRLAEKRRKYGLGRQTARRVTSKEAALQTTRKPEESIRRYRQLPPLKRLDAADEKASKHVGSRNRPRDNYASSSVKMNAQPTERRRDYTSDSSNDEGDEDEISSNGNEYAKSDESKDSGDDDKQYDDEGKIRYDKYNTNDNYSDRSCDEDGHKTYKKKVYQSDDTDLELSRDRRLDDIPRNVSPLSSASTGVNHVLKTSSYKFVPPGGVDSHDRRSTKINAPEKSTHRGFAQFKSKQTVNGGKSQTIYDIEDTVIRNSKSSKEYPPLQQSKLHDGDDEDAVVYREERTKISRRSRSASPDWSSSQSESLSRSASSQDCFDIRVTDWPIQYTQTCLLADCDKCLNAEHVTGSHHRRCSDNGRRLDDVSDVTGFSESKSAKSKWKTTDFGGGKDRTKSVEIKLNLIGHMINIGQSHRMMSCKT